MKKRFIPTLLALVTLVPITFGYLGFTKKKPIICSQQYALCTSARCIPDPKDSRRSICFCDVLDGKSLGHTTCDKRIPKKDKSGIIRVISTFSFEQFSRKNVMTCPAGSPWSDCLDQVCVVDPMNPKKAICTCKIVNSGVSQTLGGNCNTSTCDTGYWSGATVESNEENIKALMEEFKLTRPPNVNCKDDK